MTRNVLSRIGVAAGLTLALATIASAQNGSDMSGVGGGGSGLPGSLGVGVPGAAGVRMGASLIDGVSTQAAVFTGSTTRGVSAMNPATGTTMTVPQNIAQALGAALAGNAANTGALTTALAAGGGIGPDLANSVVQALTAFGGAPSLTTLRAAVTAYNSAVNASTGPVPPALVAVRAALEGAMGNGPGGSR